MNLIYEDETLQKLLTPQQLRHLVQLRELALKLRCATMRDSLVMTRANTLPLLIKERGVPWACEELKNVLKLCVGQSAQKRAIRSATRKLIVLLSRL
jgi:hypothetical protein